MTSSRSKTGFLGVALVAIAGMLSIGGEARGCSTPPPGDAARACCSAKPSRSACCCETPREAPAAAAPATGSFGRDAALPLGSCECRPAEPGAPVSTPEAPSPERRFESAGPSPAIAATFDAPPPIRPGRMSPHPDRPPSIPVLLRTSRLLF